MYSQNSLAWYHRKRNKWSTWRSVHPYSRFEVGNVSLLCRSAMQAKFLKTLRGNSARRFLSPTVRGIRRNQSSPFAISPPPPRILFAPSLQHWDTKSSRARESSIRRTKGEENRAELPTCRDPYTSFRDSDRRRDREQTAPSRPDVIHLPMAGWLVGWSAGKTCRAAYPDRVLALVQMRREFIPSPPPPLPRYYIIFSPQAPQCKLSAAGSCLFQRLVKGKQDYPEVQWIVFRIILMTVASDIDRKKMKKIISIYTETRKLEVKGIRILDLYTWDVIGKRQRDAKKKIISRNIFQWIFI